MFVFQKPLYFCFLQRIPPDTKTARGKASMLFRDCLAGLNEDSIELLKDTVMEFGTVLLRGFFLNLKVDKHEQCANTDLHVDAF